MSSEPSRYPERLRHLEGYVPKQIAERTHLVMRRGTIPKRIRRNLWHAQGGLCYYCVVPVPLRKTHLEHKHPVSRGGSDHEDNLCVSCEPCNLAKGNKTVEEFLVMVESRAFWSKLDQIHNGSRLRCSDSQDESNQLEKKHG